MSEYTMCSWILTCVYLYPFMTLQGSPGQNREIGNIYLCPHQCFSAGPTIGMWKRKNHCFYETLPCLTIKSQCRSLDFVAFQTVTHSSKHPPQWQYRLLSNSCPFISLKWVLRAESLSGSCVLIKDYSIKDYSTIPTLNESIMLAFADRKRYLGAQYCA